MLRSFEHRLNDRKLNQASQTACLAFLPQLIAVIEETPDIELRHTAISCVDRVAEKFGKKDPSAVLAAVQAISGKNCLGAAESSLQVISLLCLATMVEASGDMFISVVPKTFPAAINHLGASIAEDVEDESLHNAVYSFLGALLVYVPWAITGADLDRFLTISYESANAEIGELCDQSRSEALAMVPKQVELRECFAALVRTWPSAMTRGPLVSVPVAQRGRCTDDDTGCQGVHSNPSPNNRSTAKVDDCQAIGNLGRSVSQDLGPAAHSTLTSHRR